MKNNEEAKMSIGRLSRISTSLSLTGSTITPYIKRKFTFTSFYGPSEKDLEAQEDEFVDREIDNVTEGAKRFYIDQRGSLLDRSTVVLHDLISCSLAPLGKMSEEPLPAKFLSAFTDDASWRIIWPEYSRYETDVEISTEDVFHERCFPLVTFEWHITTDLSLMMTRDTEEDETVPLQSSFLAWANPLDPEQSPLVARGTIKDQIVIKDGYPLISHRTFALERVMQPQWLKPTSRPSNGNSLHFDGRNSPAIHKFFQAYQKSSIRIRWLRKYKRLVTPLVAVSSLFGAIQNIGLGQQMGLAFAILGVFSAALGIALLLLDYLVDVTDARIRRESTWLFTGRGRSQ